MLFALACPVFKITNLQSEMQSEMEVVGVSTRDDVKSYINKDITMDGHRMVYKTKVFNDKKSTMNVFLQCQFWRTLDERAGCKATFTEHFDFTGKAVGENPVATWKKNDKPHTCDVKLAAMLSNLANECVSAKDEMRKRAIEIALTPEHVLTKSNTIATMVETEFAEKYLGEFSWLNCYDHH